VLSGFPTYVLSNVLLLILMPIFGVSFHWQLIGLPVAIGLSMLLATVMGASIAILHVYIRDVSYALTAGMQVWYYATPVIYPLTLAHEFTGWLVANPMTGVMQLAHWSVFGKAQGELAAPVISTCVWIAALTVIALVVYRRYERVACDRL
jgi:lipopolysaccharide transport system permease protein